MTNHSSSSNAPLLRLDEKKPLGQLLNEAGLISAHQIEIALQQQAKIPQLKIGEIFSLRGWIKQETADFFAEKWSKLLQQEQKRPLVYYLRQAALLDEAQIKLIMEQRTQGQSQLRFHQIAVHQGLIKQQTIDFLIKNLLIRKKIPASGMLLSTPYKILQSYIQGQKDFSRFELKRIKLNQVNLQGINLDSSNLVEAELRKVNLSNSSLRLTNLTSANLEKAVLKNVDFECACLNLVNLTDSNLEGSSMIKTNLRGADLRDSCLVNVCFRGANLRNTRLQGANLRGSTYNSETVFDPELEPTAIGMRQIN